MLLLLPLLLCAMLAQTRAATLPQHPDDHMPEETFPPPPSDFPIQDYGLDWRIPARPDGHGHGGGFLDRYGPSFCPEGWTWISTHCLFYVSTAMTWAEAERNCRSYSKGTYESLASVRDSYRADQIHELMKKAGNEHGQVWVGGHNTADDPSWTWTDIGYSGQFHQWCSEAKREHHCMQANYEGSPSGCLADRDCDARLPSICSIVIM
ncbi:hypothetical protein INR49_001180 [Caranx melampygus]|nr:hypothetical protein INR49_001180 [Caranx melampygus]